MIPQLPIVIPVRNDAAALGRTLGAFCGLPASAAVEIIVAASGDREGTIRAVAGRARLLWPAGSTRAALMNAGAAAVVALADHAAAAGKTCHLVLADPPTQGVVLAMLAERLGLRGVGLLDPRLAPLANPSPLERRVARMLAG